MGAKVRSSLLIAVAVVSAVIGIALVFTLNPLSASWGASNSPARQGLTFAFTILIYDIPALCGIYMFSKKQEWLAPPGRYVAGERKYSVLSPYFLAACAIMAAVETVIAVTGIANVDLAALLCSFGAVYFGPLVAFVACFVAYILRWSLGFMPWVTIPAVTVSEALIDAGVWGVNAIIFWGIVRGIRGGLKGHTRSIVTVLLLAVMIPIHFGEVLLAYGTLNPYPASLYIILYAIGPTGFYLSSIVAIILGVLIGAFYYDSRVTAGEVAKARLEAAAAEKEAKK